jgi:NAD+ synthase
MNDLPYDVNQLKDDLVQYCRAQLAFSGGERAVLGISGGKDSSVVAALLAEAVGPENVHGVLMPDGQQLDIDDAHALVAHLGIHEHLLPIGDITKTFYESLEKEVKLSQQTVLNLPPRVRMTVLFGLAQSLENARVINTGNISEDWVGYATLYGDMAGAFAPLGMLTTDEVVAVGKALGLPAFLADKAPADGLTGKTDEDVLGFSYAVLNRYIRTGEIDNPETKEKIDRLHRISRFKFSPMPMFNPHFPIGADDIASIYKGVE